MIKYNLTMKTKTITYLSGRKITRYKASCGSCGTDRGYKDKNKINALCIKCSNAIINKKKKGLIVSEETKQKLSLAAIRRYNDSNWVPKSKKGRPTDNSNRVYVTLNTPEQNKMKHNMKTLLTVKIKRRSMNKDYQHTFDILDYTVDELILHLESKFVEDMTWDNYGVKGWHIDHIIPDSWFNYDSFKHEDFKNSWSLNNLQPLWAKDNLKKNNNYTGSDKCQKL